MQVGDEFFTATYIYHHPLLLVAIDIEFIDLISNNRIIVFIIFGYTVRIIFLSDYKRI